MYENAPSSSWEEDWDEIGNFLRKSGGADDGGMRCHQGSVAGNMLTFACEHLAPTAAPENDRNRRYGD